MVENHAFVKSDLADFWCVVWRKFFRRDSILVYFSTLCLVKPLLSRNFCQKCVRLNRSNFHTVHSVEKREILSHWKKISSNQLFSNFFLKNVIFMKFLTKMCETTSQQFPHCAADTLLTCGNFHATILEKMADFYVKLAEAIFLKI